MRADDEWLDDAESSVEDSTIVLTGVVPAVCDAEAGAGRQYRQYHRAVDAAQRVSHSSPGKVEP